MPSRRPQAAFEPIAPSLDLKGLVESTPNFEWVTRIHCDMIDHHGLEQFERLVLIHVIMGGKPLVIEGYESRLDKWTFAVQWLRDNHGQKVVDVRELNKDTNVPMTMEHYLKHMTALTNQWTDSNYKEEGRQRMYLKDMDCPQIWHDKLKDQIPLGLFYLNESSGDIDGLGAQNEPDPNGPGLRTGRGIAKAGDLMSSLPKEMRAENLMCYIGHEGTYTPAHREMCASLGHNIMVETSKNGVEDGKQTKAGSSIWFMTETKEREVVSEYWLSRLGHDIEVEKHFAQINAWKHAPFKVYVVEQKVGDFILIPPLAPHQVWNQGTRTMKVAWNRTTVETLEMAFNEALFKARFVCRDEQYKNKAIVYYTMQKYSKLLRVAQKHRKAGYRLSHSDLKVKQLEKDYKRMHAMFTKILLSESLFGDRPEPKMQMVPFDSNITCSYCRCNIFNRFLTCPSCVSKLSDGEDDTYDICMECYAMGRSCACIAKLQWVQQFEWRQLVRLHDECRTQIVNAEQKVDSKSPKNFMTELAYLGSKRTLAQICQLEAERRPWHDVTKDTKGGDKNTEGVEREEEVELDINGNVKKTKKKVRRSQKYLSVHARCHVDCYWEPKWKQAHCSKCDKNFCYGNLFRAYDMMPQDILADPDWQCPSCRKICGCRTCRNKPDYNKYTPKGTLLGHNTKEVADPRSVESLVDFSHSNISWIQKAGDDHEENTLRLLRRRKAAEIAKAQDPQLGDNYVDEMPENIEERILQLAQQEGIPIDPALAEVHRSLSQADAEDEDAVVEHPEAPRHDPSRTPDEGTQPEQWVPEGGIIWDSAHAYDNTEAITYVYPDPMSAVPAQIPPAPAEGYQPIVPGYEEAAAQSPERIEMVDRKRKRGKLDDGDRPYMFKKAKPKPKARERKSLVIKLTVDKDKLAQIDHAASTTRNAMDEASAPVVGSDLQALNNNYEIPSEPATTKRVDAEAADEEDVHDDEFTPGRYRDRRKPNLDGIPLPPPDADITRRTTRMQAVTYADPSDGEEEFNEIVLEKPVSKLATMEKAVQNLGTTTEGESQRSASSHQAQYGTENDKRLAQGSGAVESSLGPKRLAANLPPVAAPTLTPVRLASPKEISRPSTSSSAPSMRVSSTALAEAQANRRAKMAAIGGDADDDDDDDDNEVGSSEGSEDVEDDLSDADIPLPPLVAPFPPSKPSVGSKAPRLSLPSSNPSKSTPSTSKPVTVSIPLKKASAADWGDSSSDEDIPYIRQPAPLKTNTSFTAINGIHKASLADSAAKKRGRPTKAR